jgi:hypothetical protein
VWASVGSTDILPSWRTITLIEAADETFRRTGYSWFNAVRPSR